MFLSLCSELREEAQELASSAGKPAYIVKLKTGGYSTTTVSPGTISWRQNKFEWVETFRP